MSFFSNTYAIVFYDTVLSIILKAKERMSLSSNAYAIVFYETFNQNTLDFKVHVRVLAVILPWTIPKHFQSLL